MGKMNKIVMKVWGVLFVATLFLCAPLTAIAAEKPLELSLSLWSGGEHYHTKAMHAWAKDVETAAKGKVKIIFYPGGTLTKGNQTYNGVEKGISDIGSACNGWSRGLFPLTSVTDLPIPMYTSVQASLATWDFYKKFKPKEWNDVEVLLMFNHGHQFLHTINPVNHFEDIKNLKIRSTGNDAIVMKTLGASPVATSIGEAYISLEKGIINGILCNFGAMKGWNLASLVKNHFDYPMTGCGFWVAMNKKIFKGLPPDVQQVFKEVSEKHVALIGQAWEKADQDARRYALSLGNSINKVSAEDKKKIQEVCAPILEKYVADMEKKGLPGREALDYFKEALNKYQGR